MKIVKVIFTFLFVTGIVLGQIKKQPSKPFDENYKYEVVQEYLRKINSLSLIDSQQVSSRRLLEDTLVMFIPKMKIVSNVKFALYDLLYPYYNDHPVLSQRLNQFISYYKRINFKYGELVLRRDRADLLLREGKNKDAKNEILKLINEYKVTKYPGVSECYDLLSGNYLEQRDTYNALSTAHETLKHIDSKIDSINLPDYYKRLGFIYLGLNRPEAIDWMNKIAEYSKSTKNSSIFYSNLQNFVLPMRYWLKSNDAVKYIMDFYHQYPPESNYDKKQFYSTVAMLYQDVSSFKEADIYFHQYIKLTERMVKNGEMKPDEINFKDFGTYYFQRKQYDLAATYLKEAIKHPDNTYPYINQGAPYLTLYYIDSIKGNYIGAMRNLKRYVTIKDSSLNIVKTRQIIKFGIIYKTEQQQRNVALLQQKAKLQQIQLNQAVLIRNWILSGILMSIALIGVIFHAYRLKRRSSQTLLFQNNLLQKLLTEKEWLVKEVHHRVKNNLHTVICLLESQAVYLKNDALKAIEDCQHRVYAMSLIHQKLYQSEDMNTINMSVYLPEFIHYLKDSFGTDLRIKFNLQVEPVLLAVSQVVPLALIINEAVTNAIKHAFKSDSKGVISITLCNSKGNILLTIADNGIGFKTQTNLSTTNTLGLKLIEGLSLDINAKTTIISDNGTKITVEFRLDTADWAVDL